MPRPDSKPAIVVGVDGSDNGLRALDWAVDEAARRGVRVRMVHAYQRTGVRHHLSPQANMSQMYDEGREVFTAARAHLAGGRNAGRVVGTALYEGPASEVLIDASNRSPLCVVGRRGRGRLASRVLGSTSTTLVAESAIPLVVVPPEWVPGQDQGRHVLVGVDIPPHDIGPLDFAFAAARQASAPLVVLCAWDLGASASREVRSALGDVLGEILAPWRARFADVDVTVVVEHTHPAPALVAHAEHARLLVLGTSTRPPRPRSSLTGRPASHFGDRQGGAVARAVLCDAAVPVAVVPAPCAVAPGALGQDGVTQEGFRRTDPLAQRAGYFARISLSRSTNASESS
ncbi:universal stress protein [Actinopolymorpha sp. B11F2]|uniref:universal stress protein n=1 Tax=Actinopolymorpha sp. B11F2 TaxID=3160862 RepID=UPI0032E44FC4